MKFGTRLFLSVITCFLVQAQSSLAADRPAKSKPATSATSVVLKTGMKLNISYMPRRGDCWQQIRHSNRNTEYRIPECYAWRVETGKATDGELANAILEKILPGVFLGEDVSIETMEIVSRCEHLEILCIKNTYIDKNVAKLIVKLKNLRVLELIDCSEVTDNAMEMISRLPKLEFLDLRDSHVSIAGIKYMGDNADLKVLKLAGVTIRGICIRYMNRGLEHLELGNCDLVDDDLNFINKLTKLHSLSLNDNTEITDFGLADLEGLDKLKKLDISRCEKISDKGAGYLSKLPGLEYLGVRGCNGISQRGMVSFGNRLRLKRLDISLCKKINVIALRKAVPDCEILSSTHEPGSRRTGVFEETPSPGSVFDEPVGTETCPPEPPILFEPPE